MLAIMENAYLDTEDGRVKVNLSTSISAGYYNNCEQYNDWGHYSVPLPIQPVNIDNQSTINVVVTGYANQITDPNFTCNAGESVNFSAVFHGNNVVYKWYQKRTANGVFIQQANTPNIENEMMGNTTNHILLDMANLLVSIITYLQGIETTFNTHTHSGVTTGTDTSAPPNGSFSNPPNSTNVQNDIPRLTNNTNLAGNNYTPY
jgi:hypothetical protein